MFFQQTSTIVSKKSKFHSKENQKQFDYLLESYFSSRKIGTLYGEPIYQLSYSDFSFFFKNEDWAKNIIFQRKAFVTQQIATFFDFSIKKAESFLKRKSFFQKFKSSHSVLELPFESLFPKHNYFSFNAYGEVIITPLSLTDLHSFLSIEKAIDFIKTLPLEEKEAMNNDYGFNIEQEIDKLNQNEIFTLNALIEHIIWTCKHQFYKTPTFERKAIKLKNSEAEFFNFSLKHYPNGKRLGQLLLLARDFPQFFIDERKTKEILNSIIPTFNNNYYERYYLNHLDHIDLLFKLPIFRSFSQFCIESIDKSMITAKERILTFSLFILIEEVKSKFGLSKLQKKKALNNKAEEYLKSRLIVPSSIKSFSLFEKFLTDSMDKYIFERQATVNDHSFWLNLLLKIVHQSYLSQTNTTLSFINSTFKNNAFLEHLTAPLKLNAFSYISKIHPFFQLFDDCSFLEIDKKEIQVLYKEIDFVFTLTKQYLNPNLGVKKLNKLLNSEVSFNFYLEKLFSGESTISFLEEESLYIDQENNILLILPERLNQSFPNYNPENNDGIICSLSKDELVISFSISKEKLRTNWTGKKINSYAFSLSPTIKSATDYLNYFTHVFFKENVKLTTEYSLFLNPPEREFKQMPHLLSKGNVVFLFEDFDEYPIYEKLVSENKNNFLRLNHIQNFTDYKAFSKLNTLFTFALFALSLSQEEKMHSILEMFHKQITSPFKFEQSVVAEYFNSPIQVLTNIANRKSVFSLNELAINETPYLSISLDSDNFPVNLLPYSKDSLREHFGKFSSLEPLSYKDNFNLGNFLNNDDFFNHGNEANVHFFEVDLESTLTRVQKNVRSYFQEKLGIKEGLKIFIVRSQVDLYNFNSSNLTY